ncbi:MAG TPA: BTAD domain-containing putative transcriptional regulator, partial [Longimicrobiaceae bacterium]|nr:BTAD domain-containing putative transcriptional regulator [Longimicrobiaceae bacterium]
MIHFRLLGALDLRAAEGAELRSILAQPKRTALLAYLAAASPYGFHRRDTLLPLFWPELDDAHARNALSKAVHHLRRSLGDGVLVNRGDEEIGLCGERIRCDVVAFEEAVKEGKLSEAVELYRGDLLEGFHLSDAPDFERWLERERDRLARSWAQAVEAVASQQEAAGDHAASAGLWRRLAGRDPYNSRTARRLMQALAASGDRAGALRHASAHSSLLKEEFGAETDPEVAALADRLRGEPPVASNGRHASPGLSASAGSAVVDSQGSRAPADQSTEPEALPPAVFPEASPATSVPSSTPDLRTPIPRRWRRSAAMALAASITLLLVAVLWSEPGRGWSDQRAETAPPPISSIAVLPLENLSGDPEQEYFADGMTDALITELARFGQIRVISRTSVMQYKNSRKPLPEIARELTVDAVVQGAVLRDGDRVRITAQLVRVPTDEHLWAQSYERDLRDILALQGEVVQAIAQQVHARTAARPEHSSMRRVDPVVYEMYLKGRHFWSKPSPENIRKG